MAEGISKFTWGKKKSEIEQQHSQPIVSMIEIMSETLATELQEVSALCLFAYLFRF